MDYKTFLKEKEVKVIKSGFIVDESDLNPFLFDFQRYAVAQALERGRSALFFDCGMGKAICLLSWADEVRKFTDSKVLILAPLAVSHQLQNEAIKFGIESKVVADKSEVIDGINITNYEKLHNFDCSVFDGVVCDESSVIKHHTSATTEILIDSFRNTPYKLCCTATPSPNDHMELGTHSQFLGVMNRVEMLAMYFTHDGGDTSSWILKGHAKREFWAWVSSWAIAARHPKDLGFLADGYDLPELKYHYHPIEWLKPTDGQLFTISADSLNDQRAIKRESLSERVQKSADLVNNSTEQWIVWCDLNNESAMLTNAIPDAVEIKGSDSDKHKSESMLDFAEGKIRVIVSKAAICGWGMNFQSCHNMVFCAINHSFEGMYQAIRRCYRFGQTQEVNVHLVYTTAESAIFDNLKRKQNQAEEMSAMMVKAIVSASSFKKSNYNHTRKIVIPNWLKTELIEA